MFDVGIPEVIVLIIAAVLLFGPEKLPELARKAARVIAYVRNIADNAQNQISSELGPGFENFDIRDPKGSIRRHILDQVDPIMAEVKTEVAEAKLTFDDTTKDLAGFRDEFKEVATDTGVTARAALTADDGGAGSSSGEASAPDETSAPEAAADAEAPRDIEPPRDAEAPAPQHATAGEPLPVGAPFDRDAT